MFGDAPGSPAYPTVAGSSVFRWAALAASCWLAGVKGAESLGLVGLTLSVQQLIQDLRMGEGKGTQEKENTESERG